ncbi:thiamine phosphate synthase [bacterium]|nr:thiamine phosphate synthase [bacterium]
MNFDMDDCRFWMITDFSRYESVQSAFLHISAHLDSGVYAVTLRHLGMLNRKEELSLYLQLKERFSDKKIFLHHPQSLQYDAHLPFSRVDEIASAKEEFLDRVYAVSTHSVEEAEMAVSAGAEMVTLSPIFKPFSKPDDSRSLLKPLFQENVYLLGGIDKVRAKELIEKGAHYIAGISLFQ